jgi:hypothetical protein
MIIQPKVPFQKEESRWRPDRAGWTTWSSGVCKMQNIISMHYEEMKIVIPVAVLEHSFSKYQGCRSGSALFLQVGSESALQRKAGSG